MKSAATNPTFMKVIIILEGCLFNVMIILEDVVCAAVTLLH